MICFGVSTYLALLPTGLSEEKSSDDSSENNSDTDYFADVETSSIDSLGYQTLSRSTSEDNISKLYSKGDQISFYPFCTCIVIHPEILWLNVTLNPFLQTEQMKASTHQSISSIGKGAFARNGIMLKTGQIREGVQRKSYVLILRDSHFDSSLPEVVKGLDYTLAFHLAMGSTSIPRQLHTANESFLALRGSRKAQPTIYFCKLHPSLDVLLEGSLVKNNSDHISRAVATKQHCCNQLNEGTRRNKFTNRGNTFSEFFLFSLEIPTTLESSNDSVNIKILETFAAKVQASDGVELLQQSVSGHIQH